MPPRRSARHSAAAVVASPLPPPAAVTPAQPAAPRSAPRIAFEIVEIRREILLCLSRADLARFMRVRKESQRDVVRELYREMTFVRAEAIKKADPSRRQLYTEAVTEIDATAMKISPSMRQMPGWDSKLHLPDRITSYDPISFNFVVPYMRERYSGLRKILFGRKPEHEPSNPKPWWEVSFDTALEPDSPSGPTAYDELGYQGDLKGHVALYWPEWGFLIDEPPEVPLCEPADPPRGRYSMQNRFNTSLLYRNDKPTPEMIAKWRSTLREDFADLYQEIQISGLPFSLDDIAHVYNSQAAAGHTERLQKVHGSSILPFTIDDFSSFATVASSLTSLDLSGMIDNGEHQPAIYFRDLSRLVSVVRTSLPNLWSFTMDIEEATGAEEVCREQLTGESIRAGGTITEFRFQAGAWSENKADPPLFNAIRLLSAICAPDACITVAREEEEDPWSSDQTVYLQYLLRQPSNCQTHLSTFDFSTLGITQLREVLSLDYDADGRPKRGENKPEEADITARWAEDYDAAVLDMDEMADEARDCAEAFDALNEISGYASVRERRIKAKALLKLMLPLKAQVERLNASLDVVAVRAYVESLKD